MIERIKQIIDYKGISIRKFSEKIGISHSLLNNIKVIGSDKLENILNIFPEINPEWLLTGRGNMLKNEEKIVQNGLQNAQVSGGKPQISQKIEQVNQDLLHLLKKKDEQIDRLLALLEKEKSK